MKQLELIQVQLIMVSVRTVIAPLTYLVHGVDYSVVASTINNVDIRDLTGAGLGNVTVTVIG